jgi:hypothetical protein
VSNRDIISQDQSYRRGLVLGLTVAEIMLLLLFILLLVLSASLARLERKVAEGEELLKWASAIPGIKDPGQEGAKATYGDVMQYVQASEKALADLKANMGSSAVVADIIRELKREGFDKLPPHEIVGHLVDAKRIRDALSASGYQGEDAAKILGRLQDNNADLTKQNENLQGQNAQLSRQIKTEGRGNEFPGCWVTKDGQAESIFDITFTESGIHVHDRALPHRASEQAQLPLDGVVYEQTLSISDFRQQLRPIFDWSVQHNCRFHVRRYTSDVRTRIDLQNAMDGFFYPGTPLRTISASQ